MFEKKKESLLKRKKEDETLIKPLSPFYGDLNNIEEKTNISNENKESAFLQTAIKTKDSKKSDSLNIKEQYEQLTIFDFQTEKEKFVENLSEYLLLDKENDYVKELLNKNNSTSSDSLILKKANKHENVNKINLEDNSEILNNEFLNKTNLLDKIEYISLNSSKFDLPSRKIKKNTNLIAKLTDKTVKYIDYESNQRTKAENKNKKYKRNDKKFNKINNQVNNAKELILDNKKKSKKNKIFVFLLILLVLIITSCIGYFYFYLPYKNEIVPKQNALTIELGENLYPSIDYFFSKYPNDLKINANSINTTQEGTYELKTSDSYNGEKTFKVTVKDTQGPNVVLKYKKYQVRRTLKINPKDLVLSVDDNSGIDNLKYTIDTESFEKEGIYTVNITVEDSHGNKTTKEQTIEVVNRWAEELKQESNEENDIIL